eukprot:TRINITY_DN720_c2_g1_i1.p1 TRINITY_DN720_c2_g1~~TRINITY_DN720_c2_g1_i1.p1  ORF type:complete len:944 (+),score=239.58 TRINITY_DN720_c2_g1_i1:2637-5468(+)
MLPLSLLSNEVSFEDFSQSLTSKFWKHHFLPCYLLYEISNSVKLFNSCNDDSVDVKSKAIMIIRDLLWKYDIDERYANAFNQTTIPSMKSLISRCYLPFISIVLDVNHNILQHSLPEEHREWMVCFLYVLTYTNKQLMRNYLCTILGSDRVKITHYLELMFVMLDTLKICPGNKKQQAHDKKMLRECSRIVSQQMSFFMEDYHELLSEKKSEIFHKFELLFSELLSLTEKEEDLLQELIYPIFRVFILNFKSNVFRHSTSNFCIDSTYRLIYKCVTLTQNNNNDATNGASSSSSSSTTGSGGALSETNLSDPRELVSYATSLLYLMFRINYEENGNLLRMKIALTSAVNKLDMKHYSTLLYFIDEIVHYAKNTDKNFGENLFGTNNQQQLPQTSDIQSNTDTDGEINTKSKNLLQQHDALIKSGGNWVFHIKDIFGRMFRSIYYTLNLHTDLDDSHNNNNSTSSSVSSTGGTSNPTDPEQRSELLVCLANENLHSIEVRLKWLSKLAQLHVQYENWEEVGQCKVIISAIVAAYLSQKGGDDFPSDLSFNDFKEVAPNILNELPITLESVQSETSLSTTVNLKLLVETSNEGINSFTQANMYEEAIQLIHFLFKVYTSMGMFNNLISIGRDLKEISQKANAAIESNSRLFYNYYRVYFIGSKFGLLNNTRYIYRVSSSIRLVDFTEQIVKQFSELINDQIKTLPNNYDDKSNNEKSNLSASSKGTPVIVEPNKSYMQVMNVDPFMDYSRLKSKKDITRFDKQFGINKFFVETPWVPPTSTSTIPSEEVSEQWKKRTTFETEKYFPGILRRSRVTEEKIEYLGPLDCAIDTINSRIELITLELQLRPPNTKTLQIVLQGSVMLQVNAGPKAIIRYFFGPNRPTNLDSTKIKILREKIAEFIRKCDFALRLNEKLIKEDQKEHQKAMLEHFKELKLLASSALSLAD